MKSTSRALRGSLQTSYKTDVIEYGQARIEDVPAIADLFQRGFPEAIAAVFGMPRLPAELLRDLFRGIFGHEPSGFIVAREGARLVGFSIVTSHLRSLVQDLLLNGTIMTMLRRWIGGRYRGLGGRFVPRLLKLWWDYRRVEKAPWAEEGPLAQWLSIVVDPAVRGQGIGHRLIEETLAYLRKTPARIVRLEVDAAKPGPIHLYQKFGFQEAARLPTPRGPALVMRLHLIQ